MVFKCQEDSFLKEFQSKVVLCEKTNDPIVEYGKPKKFQGYGITLEDTILFPAGGGQPHDIGWLNDVEVLQVVRKGDKAVHFTREPLTVGSVAEQRVDWARRFDHMQQHSGQHLLSAVLENEHNLVTCSWWLGAEECHVELDAVTLEPDLLDAAEERCNQLIREARPVQVKTVRKGDKLLDQCTDRSLHYIHYRRRGVLQAHSRGLPADQDTLRVVVIDGLDETLCCGTHVSNLSQLQVVKLIGCEPGKKGKTNLRFLVGGRVLRCFQTMMYREQAFTALLKNEPKKHEELVRKLQNSARITNKHLQNVLSELARLEVERIRLENPKFVVMCKREANPEFNRTVCRDLEDSGVLLCLCAPEPERPREGQLLLQGAERHVQALGPQIIEILKGKGAFKNGKFQGKATDLSGLPRCRELLQHYFEDLDNSDTT